MSTIGSGMNGVAQGQAPAKGKAALGKATGAAQKDDFASAVASLQGKSGDGEGGRKGGRISLSAAGQNQVQAEQAAEPRKTGHRDLAALAEALQDASSGKAGAPFADKTLSDRDDTGRSPGRNHAGDTDKAPQKGDQSRVKHQAGAADDPGAVDEDVGETVEAGGDAPAGTDVGNLLEMLAAPAAIPQAVVHGVAVQAGAVQDVKAQTGGRASAKADMQPAAQAGAALSADALDAGEMPETDTDQLFRLIRADGKGRDVDMSISGTGERTSVRDANQAAAGKAEIVTVLDARRYIGLAQTGNAGAVTTAIAQDPNWAASLSATGGLGASEAAATGKVVNTLKIQMHPIELGLVTATLRLQGDALVVSLQVESSEAYRQLSEDQDAIVKALRGHSFAVDQVSVQLAPADRGTGAQQQGDGQAPQQQFSSQPQAREGGNGRQGGNGDGTRNVAGEGTSHDGNNTSENASGLAGGQPVRSGGVYL